MKDISCGDFNFTKLIDAPSFIDRIWFIFEYFCFVLLSNQWTNKRLSSAVVDIILLLTKTSESYIKKRSRSNAVWNVIGGACADRAKCHLSDNKNVNQQHYAQKFVARFDVDASSCSALGRFSRFSRGCFSRQIDRQSSETRAQLTRKLHFSASLLFLELENVENIWSQSTAERGAFKTWNFSFVSSFLHSWVSFATVKQKNISWENYKLSRKKSWSSVKILQKKRVALLFFSCKTSAVVQSF